MKIRKYITVLWLLLIFSSCKKLIEIDPPIDTITTDQVFTTDQQAEWAIAGIYSRLINGSAAGYTAELSGFAAGLSTLAGSLSADDIIPKVELSGGPDWSLASNTLNVLNGLYTNEIWFSAYQVIYDANAVIEGTAAAESELYTAKARKQFTAEAKVIRAFCYFYLVNFFGDVPLVLTIDYNKTKNLQRTPIANVYMQIIKDLKEASAALSPDQSGGDGRIRISKWAAEALLARACLYSGDYQQAVSSAAAVISKNDLFRLEADLNNVFLIESKEVIWQLAQTPMNGLLCVPEAKNFLPQYNGPYSNYGITENCRNAFEPGDKRLINWMNMGQEAPGTPIQYMPYKYKNSNTAASLTEYYVVIRLAEMYLIRAEANMLLAAGNTEPAIKDLNEIRKRADIDELPLSLSAPQVVQAVADERRRELFAEWGHRWFDLKRTGKAVDVLKQIAYKQPWKGDYQLLYPLPVEEVKKNIVLAQNPGYDKL